MVKERGVARRMLASNGISAKRDSTSDNITCEGDPSFPFVVGTGGSGAGAEEGRAKSGRCRVGGGGLGRSGPRWRQVAPKKVATKWRQSGDNFLGNLGPKKLIEGFC